LGGDTKEFIGNEQYGPLKQAVAVKVKEFLTHFQSRQTKVDQVKLTAQLESSEKAMNNTAGATLLKVQKVVGLRAK